MAASLGLTIFYKAPESPAHRPAEMTRQLLIGFQLPEKLEIVVTGDTEHVRNTGFLKASNEKLPNRLLERHSAPMMLFRHLLPRKRSKLKRSGR